MSDGPPSPFNGSPRRAFASARRNNRYPA
jgi:hypothetical protein